MPKAKKIKDNLEDMIEPYLEYMGKVAPDIGGFHLHHLGFPFIYHWSHTHFQIISPTFD